jgi:hypothetical protein
VLAALGLGCLGVERVPPREIDEATVRAAAERIERFDAARSDVELVEGGLRAAVYTEVRERVFDPIPLELPILLEHGVIPPEPQVREERRPVGPIDLTIAWSRIRDVRVHRWLAETGVELDVEGEPEPLVLVVPDAEAEALAEAIDVLRRARQGRRQVPHAPAPDGGTE